MMMQLQEMETAETAVCAEKILSLLYLQKALREEAYETCALWVERARDCGANSKEINRILRHPSWHMEVKY